MKCPTPCPACGEIVELHTMRTCQRCHLMVCDECFDGTEPDACLGCDGSAIRDDFDDDMDGDHASGLASAGFGTDEDYGGPCEDFDE